MYKKMTRKINNRNLVVCEVFDEFADKTKEMNKDVEDLVAFVTSLSQVFYWLNVESVWGRLGFVWTQYDPETKRGYGAFTGTTIPFSIIPSLPDGERITKLDFDTFKTITADEFTILNSNWENLREVYRLGLDGQRINIDLTRTVLLTRCYLFNNGVTAYVKGDFNSIPDNTYWGFGPDTFYTNITLIVDDENKYLNFPPVRTNNAYSDFTIKWEGTGTFDEDYVWRDLDSNAIITRDVETYDKTLYDDDLTSYYPYRPGTAHGIIQSDDNIYKIKLFQRIATDGYGHEIVHTNNLRIKNTNDIVDATIDCRYMVHNILNPTVILEGSAKLRKIKYIGNFDYITHLDPLLYIEGDEWYEFDTELFNKLVPNGWIIFKPIFSSAHPKKCPFVIDVTNLSSLCIDIGSIGTPENSEMDLPTQYYSGKKHCDILPTITNIHSFDRVHIVWNNSVHADINNSYVCNSFSISYAYLTGNNSITMQSLAVSSMVINDASVPCIHFRLNGASSYFFQGASKIFNLSSNAPSEINFMTFDDLSDAVLSRSTIRMNSCLYIGNVAGNPCVWTMPYIVTEGNLDWGPHDITFNPSLIYVSNRVSIYFVYTQSECETSNYMFNADAIKRLIFEGLKNDSNGGKRITLKTWIYNVVFDGTQAANEKKDYIQNTLHYTIVRQD